MSSRVEKPQEEPLAAVRRVRVVLVLILAACVLVPLAAMNRESGVMSAADNRMLAEAPTFDEGLTGFQTGLTAYMSDRIGFRNQMMAAFSLINDRAFNLMTHPLYEYGDDGYVFFRFNDTDFDERFVDEYASYIKDMQSYCLDRDIPFLYVISPEKWRMYPEYIPDAVGELPSSTAMLKERLDALDVNYIDLGEAVMDAKEKGVQVFNRVYDAGHWNTEGMYAGSQMIIDRLQEMGLKVDDIDLRDYEPVYTEQFTLPASNYPIDEMTYKYEVKEDASQGRIVEDFQQNLEMDERHTTFGYFMNPERVDDASLLMFQGSYFNTQGTMLQNQFSRIAQVHDYENIFNLAYYVDVFRPDVVVFENADYTVTDAYYSQESLESVELPPAYGEFSSLPAVEEGQAGALEYDSAVKVANFAMQLPGLPTAAYVLAGDTVYDLVLREDGLWHWGAASVNLEGMDEVTVAVIENDQRHLYRYRLEQGS